MGLIASYMEKALFRADYKKNEVAPDIRVRVDELEVAMANALSDIDDLQIAALGGDSLSQQTVDKVNALMWTDLEAVYRLEEESMDRVNYRFSGCSGLQTLLITMCYGNSSNRKRAQIEVTLDDGERVYAPHHEYQDTEHIFVMSLEDSNEVEMTVWDKSYPLSYVSVTVQRRATPKGA